MGVICIKQVSFQMKFEVFNSNVKDNEEYCSLVQHI